MPLYEVRRFESRPFDACGISGDPRKLIAAIHCIPRSECPATSPISGNMIVPRSEMRVSVVRSGFWNTVTRMLSPAPRVGAALEDAGCARAASNSPTYSILARSRSLLTSAWATASRFAALQVLFDDRRGLLLAERGFLRLQQPDDRCPA